MWHVTRDTWHVTCDTWHVTRDMWHVTWLGGWTFSQNFSSLALTVSDLCYYEDILGKGWINEWVTRLFVGQPRLHRVCQIFIFEILVRRKILSFFPLIYILKPFPRVRTQELKRCFLLLIAVIFNSFIVLCERKRVPVFTIISAKWKHISWLWKIGGWTPLEPEVD